LESGQLFTEETCTIQSASEQWREITMRDELNNPEIEPGFRNDDAEPDFDELDEPVENSEDEEEIIEDEDDEPDDEDIPLVDATENRR
jgi:hypothetical protein